MIQHIKVCSFIKCIEAYLEHKKKTVRAKTRGTSDLDIMEQIEFHVLSKRM